MSKISNKSICIELLITLNQVLDQPYFAENLTKQLGKKHHEFDIGIISQDVMRNGFKAGKKVFAVIHTNSERQKRKLLEQALDMRKTYSSLKLSFIMNSFELYEIDMNQNLKTIFSSKTEKTARKSAQTVAQKFGNYIAKRVAEEGESERLPEMVYEEKELIELFKVLFLEPIRRKMENVPEKTLKETLHSVRLLWELSSDKIQQSDSMINSARSCAYIALNQFILFYFLQKNTDFNLPELSPQNDAKSPNYFHRTYFHHAFYVTKAYTPIFSINVLKYFPEQTVGILNSLIGLLESKEIEKKDGDFLGKIFHNLMQDELRRAISAYYTKSWVAKLMADLSIQKPQTTVADFSCGAGTLLIAAYKRLWELNREAYPSAEARHKRIIEEQIFGNDIAKYATNLTKVSLAIQNIRYGVERFNITSQNALKIANNSEFPVEFASKFHDTKANLKPSSLNLDNNLRQARFPKCDRIIMNPPFSNRSNMAIDIAKSLDRLERLAVDKKYIDKRASLQVYFLYHADKMLAKDGLITSVLPLSTFTSGYGIKLIKFLSDKNYTIPYIFYLEDKKPVFSHDCNFKELIVFLKKDAYREMDKTRIIRITDEATFVSNINTNIESLRKILVRNQKATCVGVSITTIETKELFKSKNWNQTFLLAKTEIFEMYTVLSNLRKITKMKNTEITLTDGFHGTYSEFLFLPNDSWEIKADNGDEPYIVISSKEFQKTITIDRKYLVRAVRKSEFMIDPILDLQQYYILALPEDISNYNNKLYKHFIKVAERKINIKWSKGRAEGRKRKQIVSFENYIKFKKKTPYPWYCHPIKTNANTKLGNILFASKYRITGNRKSYSNFSPVRVTHNHSIFHVSSQHDELTTKFLASWFSTSLYQFSVFLNQQVISFNYYSQSLMNFKENFVPSLKEFTEAEMQRVIEKWELLDGSLKRENFTIAEQFFGRAPKTMKKVEFFQNLETTTIFSERRELDKTWLSILGINEKERDGLLRLLYLIIIEYIKIF